MEATYNLIHYAQSRYVQGGAGVLPGADELVAILRRAGGGDPQGRLESALLAGDRAPPGDEPRQSPSKDQTSSMSSNGVLLGPHAGCWWSGNDVHVCPANVLLVSWEADKAFGR